MLFDADVHNDRRCGLLYSVDYSANGDQRRLSATPTKESASTCQVRVVEMWAQGGREKFAQFSGGCVCLLRLPQGEIGESLGRANLGQHCHPYYTCHEEEGGRRYLAIKTLKYCGKFMDFTTFHSFGCDPIKYIGSMVDSKWLSARQDILS